MMPSPTTTRPRPLSPNVQIYRPQLTSVLSILNRITGIFLSACAIVLVIWLVAAAWGPQTYAAVQGAIASWVGQVRIDVKSSSSRVGKKPNISPGRPLLR